MMEPGKVVMFKTYDTQEEWQTGLLIRYDEFMGIGEISMGELIFYAPTRLIRKVI